MVGSHTRLPIALRNHDLGPHGPHDTAEVAVHVGRPGESAVRVVLGYDITCSDSLGYRPLLVAPNCSDSLSSDHAIMPLSFPAGQDAGRR